MKHYHPNYNITTEWLDKKEYNWTIRTFEGAYIQSGAAIGEEGVSHKNAANKALQWLKKNNPVHSGNCHNPKHFK